MPAIPLGHNLVRIVPRHLHVPAEGERRDPVLGLAARDAEQARTEADGEAKHLHAQQLGRDEVAELVHEDEAAQEEDDGAGLEEEVVRHVGRGGGAQPSALDGGRAALSS